MKLHQQGLCCPICGIKKGRQFDHNKCSKILQQQYQDMKHKKPKVIRESDITYMVKSTS